MIPVRQAHIHTAARSHPGSSGKNNEDRFAVSAFKTPNKESIPTVFAIVADGIGGHQAGEIAADLAVDTITHYIAESDGKDPLTLISQGVAIANKAIHDEARKDEQRTGMGSTCACAWIVGDRLYTGAVGDSRIYLQRSGMLYQLTKDHTWIQDALENGIITPEQAKDHPRAHIIRRFLGSPNAITPDIKFHIDPNTAEDNHHFEQGMSLGLNDQILLCSDGLTDLVEDNEILEVLSTQKGEQALDTLIDMANQRGGHDNITVVLLTITDPDSPSVKPIPKDTFSRNLACISLVSISVLVIIAGMLVWYFAGPAVGLPPFPLLRSASPTPTLESPSFLPTIETINTPHPAETVPLNEITSEPVVPTSTFGGATPTYTPWPTNTLAP